VLRHGPSSSGEAELWQRVLASNDCALVWQRNVDDSDWRATSTVWNSGARITRSHTAYRRIDRPGKDSG
jgi:hypothetical protein